MKIQILIADDHPVVRRGLRALLDLEPGFQVAGEAADGLEAVRLEEELRPDIVLMDIAMPGLNGLDAAQRILKRRPEAAVVLFSMYADEGYLVRALNIGVRGYLLKESADTDVVRALRAVARGGSHFHPAAAGGMSTSAARSLQERGLTDSYDLLTDREKEVLQLLAEGRSNKECARLLGLSRYTVDTHRTRLMQKLDLHSAAELVLYAVRKKIIAGI